MATSLKYLFTQPRNRDWAFWVWIAWILWEAITGLIWYNQQPQKSGDVVILILGIVVLAGIGTIPARIRNKSNRMGESNSPTRICANGHLMGDSKLCGQCGTKLVA